MNLKSVAGGFDSRNAGDICCEIDMHMTPQEYITAELEKLKQPIKRQDISDMPIEDAIYARVMSKKFRKVKATPFIEEYVKDSIGIALSRGEPLGIGLIHGGTKPWHFDEYPEVDWSELFVLMYMVKWMRYIAEVYDKGVWLELYSMDVCQKRMNNLPRSETDQYSESFKQIIKFIEDYLPGGLTITYRRWSEDFEDIDNFDVELDAAIAETTKKLNGKLPELTPQQTYATEMNVRPTDTQKKDSLWREKVEVIHMSIEKTETFEKYLNDRRCIDACPTNVDGTLVVGSTKKSMAKFWFGAGGLEKNARGNYDEVVLTPKHLKAGKFTWEDVHIEGLQGKNFNNIRVIEREQNE